MPKIQNQNGEQNNKRTPQTQALAIHYPVYYISLITGLVGPITTKKYQTKKGIIHKIYSLILVLVIIVCASYSARGRFIYVYKHFLQTVRINDIIQQVLLTISTCFAILNMIFYGNKKLYEYFQKLQKVDAALLTTMDLKRKKMASYVRFVVFHVVMIGISIYDYFAWSNTMGFELWLYYAFRLYLFYLNLLIVLQLITFTCALHTRFSIVNERLLDTFLQWSNEIDCQTKREILNELMPKSYTIDFEKYLSVRCICLLHDMLCDLLDIVNDLFGLNIFFLMSNVIINCVLCLNAILIFGTGMQEVYNKEADGAVLVLNAFWALFFLVSIYFFPI